VDLWISAEEDVEHDCEQIWMTVSLQVNGIDCCCQHRMSLDAVPTLTLTCCVCA